jgi:hypothetical protein
MFGPIVTVVTDFGKFDTFFRANKFDAIKVVTAWPLSMTRTFGLATNVVVRTTCGDPSNSNTNPYLDVNEVIKEITPWYAEKTNIYIQLGNEPNIGKTDPWDYWYFFWKSVDACRVAFPKAKIISTPLQFNGTESEWLAIMQQQYKDHGNLLPHYSGWNVYEDHSFSNPTRHDVYKARMYAKTYFDKLPVIACEVGINRAADNTRLYEYRQLINSFAGVFWFHYNDKMDNWPEYHIPV